MKLRSATATAILLLAAVTACGKSEAEQQADCQKAITAESTKTNRPEACESLSSEDYGVLLVDWTLRNGMSKEGEDTADWLDDGSVNDSTDEG
jgi:hypothetical protein